METYRTKITSKGQITIPKPLRDKYHLREGEVATLLPTDGGVVLRHEVEPLRELRGLLREELDLERASEFVGKTRKEWRLE